MSDIKQNPINEEELSNCTVEELQIICDSWERERNNLRSEICECEDTLKKIYMEINKKNKSSHVSKSTTNRVKSNS